MRVHLFPSRTQKLSACTPTILGGRLPGKIGNANTRTSVRNNGGFLFCMEQLDVHLFPVAVPGIFVGDSAPSSSADRCHYDSLRAALWAVARLHGACGRTSLRSLEPPQAALPSLPILNTEVKLMYADKPHGRLPGKIGNANTKPRLFSRGFSYACNCPHVLYIESRSP